MIETLIGVGFFLIALAPLLLYRKTDNTKWLECKILAEEHLARYEGQDKESVAELVRLFGELCVQIAACTSVWDSKRGSLLAREATQITIELKNRGFMEKTREKEGCQNP